MNIWRKENVVNIEELIKFIDSVFKLIWVFIIVCIGWQLLEIGMTGKINPNNVDSYISIILTISLYKNFEKQKWFNS